MISCYAEYIGFNNRTCSTKLSPRSTAGPVMRGPSSSMMWREWMIRVEETNGENKDYKTTSLQAFINPDIEDRARCLGYLSTFYDNPEFRGTCSIPPYGSALYLNSTRDVSTDSSQLWKIRLVGEARGEFEMIANKPDACLRILAVEDCESQPVLTDDSTSSSTTYRSWKLVKRYDLVEKASPPPPPPPPPPPVVSPPPPVPAAAPVISGPRSTTSNLVNVRVESIGGGDSCTVTSITFTSVGAAIGSSPETVGISTSAMGSMMVAVPLSQPGYNSIYAVGNCANGGTTDRSNSLSVFYTAPAPAPPPGPIFTRGANGVTIVCSNVADGDTGTVDGVEYTYRNEPSLRAIASNTSTWDLLSTTCISGVEDLSSLFGQNSVSPGYFDNFNVDISTWDTSSVIDMYKMFFGAKSFNQTVVYWDTQQVRDMGSMFYGAASFNQALDGWNTAKVTNMGSMFKNAVVFNKAINSWNVQRVKNMDSMFAGATSFNKPIDAWETKNVEDMESMFSGAKSFDQAIGNWNTGNVVDMHNMFANATSFNQALNGWDTKNVEDMDSMFMGSSVFNKPLDQWKTGKVTDMDSMFLDAIAFNQNLTMWDVALVTSCFRFASGAVSWANTLKPSLTCEQCFPADAIVYSQDKGPMQMQDVRIGDRLLTYTDAGEPMYDAVYMMGHKDAQSFGVFVSITASNNQTIRLTPDHYIFVVRNNTMSEIPSRHVEVGDGVVVDNGSIVTVVAISRVKSRGLYNPYTMTGRIVVDGILASCHSSSMLDGFLYALGIENLATGYQIAFAPIRFVYTLLGPKMFLKFEWILDAGAEIFNRGSSYDAILSWGKQMALTSAYCSVAAASLLAWKS